MKRLSWCVVITIAAIGISVPTMCFAEKTYRIEILQVTDIGPFDTAYKGFLAELKKNGIEEGKNLTVNRNIIDFDVEKGGLWKKVGVLLRIKSEASRIAATKPDLVLTVGTPATKYAKDKIVGAGIPMVFTGVAIPEAAGCESLTKAGPGFTGATLYLDMKDALKLIKLAFPHITTLGMVYSDDDNAIAQEKQAKLIGPSMGITFVTKEVSKSESITPAAQELINKGAQAFVMPIDSYYGVRNFEPCAQLSKISLDNKMPMISIVYYKYPGFIFYVGTDFTTIGSYSGKQAAKILKEGVKPDTLPIQRQQDLTIMVDIKRMKELGMQLPMQILQIAKPVE